MAFVDNRDRSPEDKASTNLSRFGANYEKAVARNKLERDKAVAHLLGLASRELIELARAPNKLPSTLETALASRLEETLLELRGIKEQQAVQYPHKD
jgi:hypothetical protein